MSLSEASRKWDVHRNAVSRLHHDPNLQLCRQLKVLTRDEEEKLANWIKGCAARGYPKSRAEIFAEAQEILKRREGENTRKLTYSWLEKFGKRQDLTFRKAASVTKAAANVTEADIRAHFARIEEGLAKEGCLELLSKPERILNADESFFVLNPHTDEVCIQKGARHTQRVVTDEKAGITVLLTVRADGKKMKPFFVYPQLRISALIDSSFPHDREV